MNVSVRKPGEPFGTRREIKNLNSFRLPRGRGELRGQLADRPDRDGRKIQQATVLYNPDTGETRAMRSKEDSADYRYFPDPDLPPLVIAPAWVEEGAGGDARTSRRDGGALRRGDGLPACTTRP